MSPVKFKGVPNETAEVLNDFLHRRITSREAGKKLGVSHQTVINRLGALMVEGYRQGKIRIEGEL